MNCGIAVKEAMTLLAGGLTPVIAVFAAMIAWRQHKIAKDKLKLDLYERRFRVYRGIMGLFAAVIQEGAVTKQDLGKFHVQTNEKEFLFGEEIIAFATEVRQKALRLLQVERKLRRLDDRRDEERDRLCEEDSEIIAWFTDELERMPKRFSKYLAFKGNL